VTLPADTTLPGDVNIVAAVTPDGRDLVFVGRHGATTQLFRRPLDQLDSVPIAGTDGATNPFLSPDGAWVGFKVGDTFRRVALTGGTPVTICDLPDNPVADRFQQGAAWAEDDTIWFGASNTGLYRVPAAGGVPVLVTTPGAAYKGVRGHYAPQALSGGRGILYASLGGGRSAHTAVYIPETDEHRRLAEGRPLFASSEHVVYVEPGSGTLWALPFDADRLEVTGEPVPVREGVRTIPDTGVAQAYLGTDGTLVYVAAGDRDSTRTMLWVDREGNEDPIDVPGRAYHSPRLSPDGTRVAVAARGSPTIIWVHDLVRGTDLRLTDESTRSWFPLWTPDGQRIVFSGDAGDLFWRAADAIGEIERLFSDPARTLFPAAWAGDRLVFIDWDQAGPTGFDLSMLSLDGDRERIVLRHTNAGESSAAVSPNGRWLAYQSNESGRYEIYLSPLDDVDGTRYPVSTAGGLSPAWSVDGTELFYRQGTNCESAGQVDVDNDTANTSLEACHKAMMSVTVETEPRLRLGTPRKLFDDPYFSPTGRHYDVASDGRFLVIKSDESLTELTVVRNWVDELQERAPAN